MAYLTITGLQIPTVEELIALTTAEQRAEIDQALAAGADTVIGMLNGITASHEREAWEAIQTAFTAINRDNAEGAILDGVNAITGTTRNPATKSYFKGTRRLTVTLDDGATVTAGVTKFAYTPDPSIRFVALDTFTNTTGVTDDFPIRAEAEDAGPIEAPSGTVTTIATPTVGLVSVTNAFDAVIGSDVENDTAARIRAERELRQAGACTNPALVADLYAYTDESGAHSILGVAVLENLEDVTDAQGLPAHSFEAIIWDGVAAATPNLDIATIVDTNKPIGVKTHGTITTTDATLSLPTRWSRATQKAFEIEITLRKDATAYGGDDAVKAACAAKAQATQAPEDGNGAGIIPFGRYLAAALGVAGVNRVTLVRMKFSGGSYVNDTDLEPAIRQVGVTDTSLITVIATTGL